jgi:hypothetical protein
LKRTKHCSLFCPFVDEEEKSFITLSPGPAGLRPTAKQRLDSGRKEIRIYRFIRLSRPVSSFDEGENEAGNSSDGDDDDASDAGVPHVRDVVDGEVLPPVVNVTTPSRQNM